MLNNLYDPEKSKIFNYQFSNFNQSKEQNKTIKIYNIFFEKLVKKV